MFYKINILTSTSGVKLAPPGWIGVIWMVFLVPPPCGQFGNITAAAGGAQGAPAISSSSPAAAWSPLDLWVSCIPWIIGSNEGKLKVLQSLAEALLELKTNARMCVQDHNTVLLPDWLCAGRLHQECACHLYI